MRSPRRSPFVAAVLLVILCLPLVRARPAVAQSPNLLFNPGFERPYVDYPGKENCRIAAGWTAYWYEGGPEEVRRGYRLAPEYKAAFRADFPGNRVRNGELSQQYFHSYGNFEGGVWQQVPNIVTGTQLRFEMWAMTWSCDKEDKGNCPNATSGDPSPMHLRIGIDPNGATDALAKSVVWSPEQNAYDSWTLLRVDAVAQGPKVTVFVYSYPDYRSQDNNVYLDDASLIALAPPAPPTPRPTTPPTATPIPTQTAVPTNTGMPTVTPVPPTNTPVPTNTVVPTATATKVPPTVAPTHTVEPTKLLAPETLAPTVVTPVGPGSGDRPALAGGLSRDIGWIVTAVSLVILAFILGYVLGRRSGLRS